MNTEIIELLGANHGPRPSESSLNVVMRLCWVNVMTRSDIQRKLKFPNKPLHSTRSIAALWRLPPENLQRLLGWKVPAEESAVFTAFENQVDTWFQKNYRYCPLCLEQAYHSFWHQFVPLEICPVHSCRLTELCQVCGKRLGIAGFTKDLLDEAFLCPHCGCPIYGSEPLLLGEYCDCPLSPDLLRDRFRALNSWASTAAAYMAPVRRQISCHQVKALTADSEVIARATVHAFCPLPAFCSQPLLKIDMLAWDVRMRCAVFLDVRGARFGVPSIINRIRAVYRIVLRQLERGLTEEERRRGVAGMIVDIRRTGVVQLDGIRPEYAAYAWFRHHNEHLSCYDDATVQQLSERRLDNFWFLHTLGGMCSRLAAYAGLMGLYGIMLHVVRGETGRGRLDVRTFAGSIEGAIPAILPARSGLAAAVRESGIVFFPSFPAFESSRFQSKADFESVIRHWHHGYDDDRGDSLEHIDSVSVLRVLTNDSEKLSPATFGRS